MFEFIEFLKKYGNHFKNPITIVDISAEDQPLIYVNDQFCKLTGYAAKDILGRNCRFLQGKDTDKQTVRKIREQISQKKAFCEDIKNYRKDRSEFYNRLVLIPHGTFFIGLQNEIPKDQFQKFKDRDDLRIRDEGLNPLTVIYLSIVNSKESDEETLKKLDSFFERIHQFVLNL